MKTTICDAKDCLRYIINKHKHHIIPVVIDETKDTIQITIKIKNIANFRKWIVKTGKAKKIRNTTLNKK